MTKSIQAVVIDHAGGDEVDGLDNKCSDANKSANRSLLSVDLIHNQSPEKLYCDVMQPLQFGEAFDLI